MKKILSFVLLAAMLLTTLVVSTSAAAWDGTTVSASLKGEGTAASPYLIESAADLAFLAKSVNEGTNYAGKYITQTADIDLGGKEWTPIGTSANPFSGVYDGKAHKVTGFSIKNKDTDITGLFGYVESKDTDAGLANITVEGAITIDAPTKDNNGVGGLVGQVHKSGVVYAKRVYVINCTSDVDITVTNCAKQPRVGGLAGYAFFAVFENCVNNGNINYTCTATTRVAGFVGQTNSATYKGCVNNGNINVTVTGNQVSRVCGMTSVITVGPADPALYTEFVNCVNNGDIVNKTGKANAFTAGIAGDVYPTSKTSVRIKITDCVNTGDMKSILDTTEAGSYPHTGGIGAYFGNDNSDIYITGCVNTGKTEYEAPEKTQNRASGLMGSIYSPNVTDKFVISNCISTTTIHSDTWNIGYSVDKGVYRDAQMATNKAEADAAVATAAIKAITDKIAPSATKIAGFDTAYKAPVTPTPTPTPDPTPSTGDATVAVVVLATVALFGIAFVSKKVSVR